MRKVRKFFVSSADLFGFRTVIMSARLHTFGSLSLHMHCEKNSLSQFNVSVPQLLMNSGGAM